MVRAVMGDLVARWGSLSPKRSGTCALMLHVLPPATRWIPEGWGAWALSDFRLLCDFRQMLLLRWGLSPPKGARLGLCPGREDRGLRGSAIPSAHKAEHSRQIRDLGLKGWGLCDPVAPSGSCHGEEGPTSLDISREIRSM